MVPVKCPRCTQVWYSDEAVAGRARLCTACADELQRRRRPSPLRLDAFLVTVAALLAADVALIVLARLWPQTFGRVLLVYGCLLLLPGLAGFRLVARWGHVADIDWSIARWPAAIALLGLASVLAYGSFAALSQ